MSVDFTIALKVKSPEALLPPADVPTLKDSAESFSNVLAKSERAPQTENSRNSSTSARKNDPVTKKAAKPAESKNGNVAPPTAEDSPNSTAPENVAPQDTAEEVVAATPPETQAKQEEVAVQEVATPDPTAVTLPTIPLPPAPPPVPILPQPVLKSAPAVEPVPDSVPTDEILMGFCGIEEQTSFVVTPVQPVTDEITPTATITAEIAAEEEPTLTAQITPIPLKSTAAKTPAPVKSTPPEEPPPVVTVETEKVVVAPVVEQPPPKAEKKEERDEPREREPSAELTPIATVVPDTVVTPISTETTNVDSAAKSTDAPPPVTNDNAATNAVESRPIVDAPQATNVPPPNASPSRFPPSLTGRTAATREATARPDVDTTRFLRRVVGAFQAAEERGTDVKLRLRPPELGALQISVKIQDGAMTATMEAETPSAKTLILDNLPQLRERLAEQGMRIEKFEVNVSDRQTGGGTPDPGPQSRDQSPRQQHDPRTPTARNASRDDAAPRPPRVGPDAAGLNVLV